jgi:hypothetical protein
VCGGFGGHGGEAGSERLVAWDGRGGRVVVV